MENERIEEQEQVSKRKQNPMLVSFDDVDDSRKWEACRKALETDYTVSIRDACQLLKCDRTWIQQYIRPRVHYVYLQPRYALRVSKRESVWINKKEFDELIYSNITCTRRTITVPMECLLEPDAVDEYQHLVRAAESAKKNNNWIDYEELCDEIAEHIDSNLSETGKAVYAKEIRPNRTRRTAIDAVPTELPKFRLEGMIAIHDIKEYGDTTEVIYRSLFDAGVYRLQLNLPNADGVLGERIYYLKPEKDETAWLYNGESVQSATIAYADYLKYFADDIKEHRN